MIDVFVEMLKCKRSADNKHMEGEFRMSSQELMLTSDFGFQMDADNLTQISQLKICVNKNGKPYCVVADHDAFNLEETKVVNDSQKIVLRALSEVLEYFWGVHEKAQGVPATTISGFITLVPDEMAMEILGACL